MSILFTQYKLPNGDQEHVTIDLDTETENKAHALLDHGFKFDIEILTTGIVSMSCEYPTEEIDADPVIGMKLSNNDPSIPENVKALVDDAYNTWQENQVKFPARENGWRRDLETLEAIRKKNLAAWDF